MTLGAWASDWVVDGRVQTGRSIVVVLAVIVVALASAAVLASRDRSAMFVALLSIVAFGRGVVEWSATPASTGRVAVVATLADDPDPSERGTHAVFEIDGRRVDAWLYGRMARRIERVSAGERVLVTGRVVESSRPRRDLLRHIVGRIRVDDIVVTGRSAGHLHRSVNRLRNVLADGASSLPDDRRDLLTGLLYGDDRRLDRDVVDEFRRAGLAHLTAVSGQNVAYVMAVFAPLLGRMRRRTRIASSIGVLAVFVILTRAEPSVVRAALMAGTALVLPRTSTRSLRALSSAVVVGVIVDPFLVWSVGWWLSVSGCAGLVVVSPLVERALGGGRVASFVAPTIGAQVTVLPVSAAVFGWPDAIGIVTNLIAGPIAGAVMLIGLPIVLVAALVPDTIGSILVLPVDLGVRAVAAVASRGARAGLPTWLDVMAPLFVVTLLLIRSPRAHLTRVATLSRGTLPRSRIR
ncbi:MAG: ComEC/Rec2 family competence protein [Actinobacteria bacterium]|nr:ComEC/Rec2 family competence protein [Actinomycetota bacterium]